MGCGEDNISGGGNDRGREGRLAGSGRGREGSIEIYRLGRLKS